MGIVFYQNNRYSQEKNVADILTTEVLLILLLAFCMGAKIIRARIDGHEVSVSGDDDDDENA